ncbi:uncharacterized protein SCHCODRAFT_02635613 [Schizophyllum commune H4-8]|uniref:uncharacterized protein n=1 Tax=Schizophyllum commune (strain H4-8 / FGSC 9210) TaxID=578458 RepID=UPI00215F2930|nr:uncharacterized protein SCHCODRAFT_02635613 [Schizophyllum commune H4-8]KAI5889783.1 hypothetical protein SCHCODRAFT_02635613 [Schizophyllum commune H4-8]
MHSSLYGACFAPTPSTSTYVLGITAALADVLLRRLMLTSTSSRMEIHSRTRATAVEGAVQRVAATRSAMVQTEQCVDAARMGGFSG